MDKQIEVPHNKSLSKQKKLKLSLQFGYIGLGMGGCAIAAECASIRTGVVNNFYPYTGLLVNTNTLDFEKLRYSNKQITRLQLKGYEKGAGRNMDIGEEAFLKHKDKFLETVKNHFSNRDFMWIVCGLGGGTGTGSILQVINALHQNGYSGKFGLVLILPRNGEGSRVFQNALNRLQKIAKVMAHIGSIILVDNNKLYQEFIQRDEPVSLDQYLSYSNRYVAQMLHELNAITASFSPFGDNHFDSSEFQNLISTPGLLHISRVTIEDSQADLTNELSYTNALRQSIENGVLSDGYQLKKTNRAALSVLANKSTADRLYQLKFINQLEQTLQEYAPLAEEKPVSLYVDSETKDMHFYAVFSGLDLPKRIKELVEETQRMNREAEELDDGEDDIFQALSTFKGTERKEQVKENNGNLFEDEDEYEKENKPAPLFGDETDTKPSKKATAKSVFDIT